MDLSLPAPSSALVAPTPALADCVRAFYWHDLRPLAAVAPLTLEQRLTRIPPGPYNGLVWMIEGQAQLVHCGGQAVHEPLPPVFVAGTHRHEYRSLAVTPYCSFGLALQPVALALLTGHDWGGQLDRISPATAVLPPDWAPLLQGVAGATSHAERIDLCEAFLAPRWAAVQGGHTGWAQLLRHAWRRHSQGAALALLNWSQRHFQRRTRALTGLKPSEVERMLRLERAMLDVRDGRVSRAEAAAEHGYADQPHFTRELAAIYKRRPAELSARLKDPEAAGDWLLKLAPEPRPPAP